jgi:hypothetical protein
MLRKFLKTITMMMIIMKKVQRKMMIMMKKLQRKTMIIIKMPQRKKMAQKKKVMTLMKLKKY